MQLEAQLLWSEGVACSMTHFVHCVAFCGWPVALPDTRRFRLILCDSGDLCFGFACRTNVHLCAGVCAAPGSTAWELALDQPEPSVRGRSRRVTLPPLHRDWAPPLPHLHQDCAPPLPHLHRDCAPPLPHLHQDWATCYRPSNATSTFGNYLNSTLMVARSWLTGGGGAVPSLFAARGAGRGVAKTNSLIESMLQHKAPSCNTVQHNGTRSVE